MHGLAMAFSFDFLHKKSKRTTKSPHASVGGSFFLHSSAVSFVRCFSLETRADCAGLKGPGRWRSRWVGLGCMWASSILWFPNRPRAEGRRHTRSASARIFSERGEVSRQERG